MSTATHTCLECGSPATGRGAKFCSSACRLTFNNRRMRRGAEMYDLFRALRRERSTAKAMNIWTELCRLELRWQEEDEKERPGRRSYMPPREALANLYDTGRLMRGEIIAHAHRVGR